MTMLPLSVIALVPSCQKSQAGHCCTSRCCSPHPLLARLARSAPLLCTLQAPTWSFRPPYPLQLCADPLCRLTVSHTSSTLYSGTPACKACLLPPGFTTQLSSRLQAFTPIVTMLVLFAAGLETLTVRLVTALALVTFGTALASLGEVNLSLVGIACMLASETFEAVRLVMTQILLVEHKFHPSES